MLRGTRLKPRRLQPRTGILHSFAQSSGVHAAYGNGSTACLSWSISRVGGARSLDHARTSARSLRRASGASTGHGAVRASDRTAAGNALRLEWSRVGMRRKLAWIHSDQAKGRRSFSVPLNETALAVLKRCKDRHPNEYSPIAGSLLRGRIRRRGGKLSSAPASKSSDGTIYGIPGRAGMCSTALRYLWYRIWALGVVK